MSATIAGFGILRGEIVLPDQGLWVATIEPFDDAVLASGQRVSLEVGTLTLSGTILPGLSAAIEGAGASVIGGAGGWDARTVDRRAYQDDAGVRLEEVLRDLAREAGEELALASALASVVLGRHWVRRRTLASDALVALGRPWRMRADGVTEVGALAETESAVIASLRKFLPVTSTALLELPEDDFAELVPGRVVDLGSMRLRSRELRLVIGEGSIRAEVRGIVA